MTHHFFLQFVFAVLALGFSVPVFADDKQPHERDLTVRLNQKGFNTFTKAVADAGLKDHLSAPGKTTVLAPTDNAFRDLPKAELDALLSNKEKLKAVILNHLIDGRLTTADLKSGTIKTQGGKDLETKSVDGKIKIGIATVVKPDIESSNGIIQGIDKILVP